MSLIMHACVICNCTCTCSCICMLHHRRPHLASYAHDLCAKSFAFHCAAFHSGLCYSILVLRIGGLWDLSRQFIFLQLSRKIFGRGSFEQDMFFHRRNETNLFRRSVPFYRTTRIVHAAHTLAYAYVGSYKCRQRLGGLVAYIPLPVVAGYLGYLGYFCVAAALTQVTGLHISSPLSMRLVLTHPERWPNVAALVLCCAVIQITVNRHASCPLLLSVPFICACMQQ